MEDYSKACTAANDANPQISLPAKPTPMVFGDNSNGKVMVASNENMERLQEELRRDRETWQTEAELSRQVNALCSQATSEMQYGIDAAADKREQARRLLSEREEAFPHQRGNRAWNLQNAYEEYIKIESLDVFFRTGKALQRSSLGEFVEDEEYMSGIISMCQELAHYALRRATALDACSVRLCRKFISDVKAELLDFDFRNGPLRRKFDGIKYAERRCQDLLYELSFTESNQNLTHVHDATTVDQEFKEEWSLLREAYAEFDRRRELVIKDCRDVQKAAKQAIYAAHRKDLLQAARLIKTANEGVKSIWDSHVKDLPSLRHGSFANALEELAEAELFVDWLKKSGFDKTSDQAQNEDTMHLLCQWQDLGGGKLNANEYLGALSDFSGEIGRVAVEAATRRDRVAVHRCLRCNYEVHEILSAVVLPGKENKKVEAAERNLRKLETIEYDLAVRANTNGPPPPLLSTQSMESPNDANVE